ncbi:hypothetical protein J7J12_02200 [bacterium]|nr:hypothetical protein [bacterium]
MAKRKIPKRNIRKLTKVGGKSYAVTLPIEIIRLFNWKERQKVILKINKKRRTITIKDWEKN